MLQLQQGPVLIHELLKQGYQATIIFSGDMLVPPFNQTVFREIDHLRVQHAPGVTVPDRDHAVTTEFLQFLAQRDRQQPFFSFLFYDSAHNYCTRQNIPMIYKTTSLDCSRLTISDSPADHDMHSRYNNAVHYVDTQVALVLTALKEQGLLDNTIILLTGDHGEEFSDDQQAYFSHASNYTKYQIQTPFVLYWPRQTPAIWTHQTSHYDIAPYLLKHVLGCRNPLDDYSLGKDLLTGERPDYLLVGSYMNMAIVEKNRYTTLLASGDIRITDNQAKEVPGARVDLNILKRALFEMRKFYR